MLVLLWRTAACGICYVTGKSLHLPIDSVLWCCLSLSNKPRRELSWTNQKIPPFIELKLRLWQCMVSWHDKWYYSGVSHITWVATVCLNQKFQFLLPLNEILESFKTFQERYFLSWYFNEILRFSTVMKYWWIFLSSFWNRHAPVKPKQMKA